MFESSLYYFGYWYFQALSLSRTHGLKSPNSYEIAYDKYRESLSFPHPPMHDNIVYRRSHRLAIWRYESRRICKSSVSRHLQRFFPLLEMAEMDPPLLCLWLAYLGVVSNIFFMTAKRTKNTLVSFDRTDKNKVSFESAKGLLLFLYSHNNNEIMCFSKINK